MTATGQRIRLAKGGNGGFGNAHFTTSTNRAPRRANPGLAGEERWLWLRLKLIADAGPRRPAECRQVDLSRRRQRGEAEDRRLSVHDAPAGPRRRPARPSASSCSPTFPGLIEGAHEGAGLGDRFLGHIERCRVLLHLVDGTSEHAGRAYRTVREELDAYGHGLAEKPEIVALSKADALDPDTLKEQVARLKRAAKRKPFVLSAVSGQGVPEVLRACSPSSTERGRTPNPPRRGSGSRDSDSFRVPAHRPEGRLRAPRRPGARPAAITPGSPPSPRTLPTSMPAAPTCSSSPPARSPSGAPCSACRRAR